MDCCPGSGALPGRLRPSSAIRTRATHLLDWNSSTPARPAPKTTSRLPPESRILINARLTPCPSSVQVSLKTTEIHEQKHRLLFSLRPLRCPSFSALMPRLPHSNPPPTRGPQYTIRVRERFDFIACTASTGFARCRCFHTLYSRSTWCKPTVGAGPGLAQWRNCNPWVTGAEQHGRQQMQWCPLIPPQLADHTVGQRTEIAFLRMNPTWAPLRCLRYRLLFIQHP